MKIVICLHGNERIGLDLMDELNYKYPFIIGNPKALKQNRRFIDTDLNRSFLLNSYSYESKRAKKILNLIGKDFVIDIHSTQTEFPLCAIVTKMNGKILNKIKEMGIKRVIDLGELSDGNSLIDNTNGFSLEVGEDYSQKALQELVKCFQKPKKVKKIEHYEYIGTKEFKGKLKIKNMKKVKKGDLISVDGDKKYYATSDFYPMFEETAYENKILKLEKKK